MRAARYRLRFYTGATLTNSLYGGGKYGDGTYGMTATDALTTAHHRLVPWPGGYPTGPSWVYRQWDTQPDFQAQIIADDGVVDYEGLDQAVLVLTPVDAPNTGDVFELTVQTAPNGDERLTHKWLPGELSVSGNFRPCVVLAYTSGRWMTVTADDAHNFRIVPGERIGP